VGVRLAGALVHSHGDELSDGDFIVTMRWKGFTVGRPQQVAALLLLMLFAECLWTIAHRPLDANDYRYALCGRQMWERPSPLAGYFTTCGNLNGDGTFAYRVAGLPLTLQRLALLAADHFRKPENRLYAGGVLNGSTWEARHQLALVNYLLRVPFSLFAVWLGGGLWWVAKRLFGAEGGALALALYVFCPAVVRSATMPNNEMLAAWGLYGTVYTAMGVAHALQGPRRKWRPRIVLLTLALGLTAAAHLLAGVIGLMAGTVFFYYLAERRRAYVAQIMLLAAFGAMVIVFASFGFRPTAFLYVFAGGSMRFWFSIAAAARFFGRAENLAIGVAVLVAVLLYATTRRSRYFGNTAALMMVLALATLYTTQVVSSPWFWALPFLFTFVGGVFADVLETRQRKVFLLLSGGVVVTQAVLCWMSLAGALG
jgi:multisubunit Na+/H+ antiporter MnhE subunit